MQIDLTESQALRLDSARRFAEESVAPWAAEIDRRQLTPAHVLSAIKRSGYLGAALPTTWGGGGFDPVSYGVVTGELGKACSSVRSLMTVHNMSAQAVALFGSEAQRNRWLPDLSSGERLMAFALSEPAIGSDAKAIQTEAVQSGGEFIVSGMKKWITYGQLADLFLVFAKHEQGSIALVIDRRVDGLSIEPQSDLLGTRGSMLAMLHFDNVRVPAENLLGSPGMGIKWVANVALDHGRYSVGWGCVGIIHACLDASLNYAQSRQQGGKRLADHQLIRRKLTNMLVDATTARAVCIRSGHMRERGDPRAATETSLAKYHASVSARRAATNAVRLHGANGCSAEFPVNRFLRDATVMGVVEGTDEMQQLTLADYALQRPYRH